jgi:hypothetical protein
MPLAQKSDHLFGVDNANETFVMIDYGERAKVVFIEEFGHFFAVGVDTTTNEVAMRELGK